MRATIRTCLDGKWLSKKFQIVNIYSCTPKRADISVFVDDQKMGRKKNNLKPIWNKLMKQVDLEEPTPLLNSYT